MPTNEREFQARLRAIFDTEAGEHLRALTDGLFAIEQTSDAAVIAETIETLFREAHTLKGGARLVGEREAEGICQELETLFSKLKNHAGTLSREQIVELRSKVNTLREALNPADRSADLVSKIHVAVDASSEKGSTPPQFESPPASEKTAPENRPAFSSFVRVPSARLDALLVQTEELFATKASTAEHFDALQTLNRRVQAWKRQWTKVRPQLASARQSGPKEDPHASRDLKPLWQFLEWNQEFFSGMENELDRLTREFGREQRGSVSLIDGLLEQTKEVLMMPFSSLTESFPPFIADYSKANAKPIDLQVEGGETQIDRRVLDEIKDAMLHLVRNAIDHGIESATERRQRGKPERSTLTISVVPKSGSSVEIAVRDDGGGIDLLAIRRAAVRQNLLSENDTIRGDEDLLSLLFRSGFSTRSTVTELSGRGLGLAIVAEKVERLGGNVTIETSPEKGTAFRLLLPITMARFRGVFVTAAGKPFVISSAFVEEILRISPDQIRSVKSQLTVEYQGHPVLLVPLADALGLSAEKPSHESGRRFVVVVRAGQTYAAFAVDDAPYESEVIMKDLGRLLPRVRNISGATTIGSGKIVPVLNAADLVRSASRRTPGRASSAALVTRSVETSRRILIVEDSITSRTLLKSILEAAGFEVRTAFDGIEAMTLLKFEPVDLVVSDVQMPRMDGIELTRKIRADASLSTLPIILVTSLASREDKERGVDAGANAYIVKSSFDQSDLLKTVERLL